MMQFKPWPTRGLQSRHPRRHESAGTTTAGTSNFNSGGDGAYNPYGDVFDGYHQGTLFSRFSYDLTDNITFYVQGTAAESRKLWLVLPAEVQPGTNQAAIFYKNNPFLTPAEQTQLGNNGTNPTQLGTTAGCQYLPAGRIPDRQWPDRDQCHRQRQPRAQRPYRF